MHIEGYLFVEHRGQYRFSLKVMETEKKVKGVAVKSLTFSGMEESKRMHDYLWDVTMRGRPTLHELIDKETESSRRVFIGWKDSIYEHLNRNVQKVLQAKNTPIRCKLGGGYVEFAHVE